MKKYIQNDELKQVQESLIELLEVLKKAMTEVMDRKIKPVAAYGTMLGAIRHQGMIPWDDDIDIMVSREDYEYLKKHLNKALPEGFEFYHEESDVEDYPYLFGKVVNKNITFIEKTSFKKKTIYPQHLFIDIFPMDRYGNQTLKKEKRILNYIQLKILAYNSKNIFKLILLFIGKLSRIFLRKKIIVKKWKKLIYRNDANTIRYICHGDANEAAFEPTILSDVIEVPFSNSKIWVPREWENYLEKIYGDWKAIPSDKVKNEKHYIKFEKKNQT